MNPPVNVLDVLELARDALLGGSGGYLVLAGNGRAAVTWLPRKGAYRVTIDLKVGGPYDREYAERFNAVTFDRVAGLRADGTYA